MFDRWEKGMCYLNRHIEMSILSVGSNFSRRELEAPALVFVHHFMLILAAAGERYRRYVPHLRPTLAGFGSWIAGRPEESFPTCHPPVGL